jgi:tetratricopeptide (TPR) repeat protein
MLSRILLVIFILLVIISAIYALRDTREYTTDSDEALQKFEEAMDLISRLYTDEGYEAVKEALELDSNFAMAWSVLASRNRAYGYNDEAERNLERAFVQYDRLKKHEKMMLDIRRAFFDGNEAVAVEKLHEFTKAFPNRIEGHQSLGTLAWEKGRIEEAIYEFEKVLEINPDYAPTYNSLGYLEFGRGNFNKSLEHFKTYISLLPDQANPHDSKGEILMAVGRYDEALKEFKTANQLEPGFDFVLYHLASAYAHKGMFSKVDQTHDKIEKLIKDDWEMRTLNFNRVTALIARGDNAKALDMSVKLIYKGEKEQDSSLMLWAHIMAAFSTCEINTDTAMYHLNIVDTLIGLLMPERKLDYLGEEMGWYTYLKAKVDLKNENYNDVLYIESPLEDKRFWRPDSKFAHRNLLAKAYFGLGQKQKAYDLVNINLGVNPNFPNTLMTLAELYEKDDQIDSALKTIEKLLEVYKDADDNVPRIEEWKQKYAELSANPA